MKAPVATAGMMIRRPVAIVREAFIDPAQTTRFWFTDSTGPLTVGAEVTWTWAMYGVSTQVVVKAVEPGRILMDWDNATEPTEVEWTFEPRGDHTLVGVINRGFKPGEDAKAIDAAGGFSIVLCAAKIWLEHNIDPRFIVDAHPDYHVEGWPKA